MVIVATAQRLGGAPHGPSRTAVANCHGCTFLCKEQCLWIEGMIGKVSFMAIFGALLSPSIHPSSIGRPKLPWNRCDHDAPEQPDSTKYFQLQAFHTCLELTVTLYWSRGLPFIDLSMPFCGNVRLRFKTWVLRSLGHY